MLWHAFELFVCECVHEACLTDTVSTDESVFSAISQAKFGVFKQRSTTDDDIHVIQL